MLSRYLIPSYSKQEFQTNPPRVTPINIKTPFQCHLQSTLPRYDKSSSRSRRRQQSQSSHLAHKSGNPLLESDVTSAQVVVLLKALEGKLGRKGHAGLKAE